MQTDLLVQLLEKMIATEKPPDIFSREYDDDECTIIRLEWFTGRVMKFGYTRERYDAAWKLFQSYWAKRSLCGALRNSL